MRNCCRFIFIGPLNGLSASSGNRNWSTASSLCFVQLKTFILARGYRLPTGGGEMEILSNKDWRVAFTAVDLIVGRRFPQVLLLELLMVLISCCCELKRIVE